METETKFQWSDILTTNETNYQDYIKLTKIERDKYMKFEVRATVTEEAKADLERFGIDAEAHLRSEFDREKDFSMSEILLKQMKYHCGKPLKINLVEKGPRKYQPIKDYFWRNVEYLTDYDYMIVDQQQFQNMIAEDFDLFDIVSTGPSIEPFTLVATLKNLKVYVVNDYPQKDLRMDEFDTIIGKKGWIDIDTIKAQEGSTEDGYANKYLLKMSFPVKRGFMRISAKFE